MNRNKKIAIHLYERNHYSFLNELIESVSNDCEVFVYGYKHTQGVNLGTRKVTFLEKGLFGLVKHQFSYDLVIIDEVNDARMFIIPMFLISRNRVELVVHNLTSWFKPSWSWRIRNLIVIVYRFILSKLFLKYIVVGTNLKEWALANTKRKTFRFIPFGFTLNAPDGQEVNCKRNGKLLIVIPGMVSRRRKYNYILRLIEDEAFHGQIDFVLLGKPSDEFGYSVIDSYSRVENVITFDKFVSHQLFHSYVSQCDFLLSDFDLNFETMFGQHEKYGITKETGVLYLMLRYGKPAILPHIYNGMKEMQSQMLYFNCYEELREICLALVNKEIESHRFLECAMLNKKLVGHQIEKIL